MEFNLTDQARRLVRNTMLKLRSDTPASITNSNKAIITDIRSGFLNGVYARRLIIHLHSSGCGYAIKTGGCTMCGFYAATSTGRPISTEEYQEQVRDVFSKHDPQSFQIIGLYNAGNILNEDEMPFEALEKICVLFSQNPFIKRLSIESRPEFIDVEKLKRISSILKGKEIELGIGVETLNEKVKDLCINKPCANELLQQKVDILLGIGIVPKAYLLLKPPFMTEKEAIDDFILSYSKLNLMGVHRIDCETMTVQKHTLVYQLWKENYYRTPWLWSIINLLEQMQGFPLYFTPFRYIVNAVDIAHNCDKCSDSIKKDIFDYQDGHLSSEELFSRECDCKKDWINELENIDERSIETRIIETLSGLQIA